MSRLALWVGVLFLPLVLGQSQMEPVGPGPASQPAPVAAPGDEARRPRPKQSAVLEELLREREREGRIRPQHSALRPEQPGTSGGRSAPDDGLLTDGMLVIDRAGRLLRTESKSQFRFHAQDEDLGNRTLELLKNGWLERMERDAELGATDFYITAEVTRYRGENYLLVQKYRRQVGNGNLSP